MHTVKGSLELPNARRVLALLEKPCKPFDAMIAFGFLSWVEVVVVKKM